ncbi:MAG TPA: isocitrate lyase/phosphoenolpyruvate mutase family protein, partial [Roseiarcus sp.]|nr:isocitrate lyase/phosphoenolpyruvate mutase family protein [Roseiarcus sp.]
MMPTIAEKRARFAELHAGPGCFVIPNPFDVGSAKYLASLGFPALASTSAGKPSEARYLAEPMSNGLGITKQPGAACSSAKRARFS